VLDCQHGLPGLAGVLYADHNVVPDSKLNLNGSVPLFL
jgi:hypothetical protein